MNFGVIGAGASGLAVGRTLIEDMNVTDFIIFEQGNSVGGTWIYTDEVGNDEYGLPIHSSMYKSLRTNLPKELMEFKGFSYDSKHDGTSYLNSSDIVEYLEQFAERFKIFKKIKFRHHVMKIEPTPDGRWSVTVKNLPEERVDTYTFDAVFVCNGHLQKPNEIHIKGQSVFKGDQLHSHHYRRSKPYENKIVLVIGAGPSGIDISCELAEVCKKVYFSHHDPNIDVVTFPDKVIKKPDIKYLSETSVTFMDNTVETIDCVLYCTGYKINMPFMTPECDLEISDYSVDPLFMHMININRPSMFFIGLVNRSFLFPLFEMQAQFCLKFFKGIIKLTKENMLERWKADKETDKVEGFKPHFLGSRMEDYFNSLSELGCLDTCSPVWFKIYDDSSFQKKLNFLNYRNDVYTIIDSGNFIKSLKEKND